MPRGRVPGSARERCHLGGDFFVKCRPVTASLPRAPRRRSVHNQLFPGGCGAKVVPPHKQAGPLASISDRGCHRSGRVPPGRCVRPERPGKVAAQVASDHLVDRLLFRGIGIPGRRVGQGDDGAGWRRAGAGRAGVGRAGRRGRCRGSRTAGGDRADHGVGVLRVGNQVRTRRGARAPRRRG